jgi:hypothetical protein
LRGAVEVVEILDAEFVPFVSAWNVLACIELILIVQGQHK